MCVRLGGERAFYWQLAGTKAGAAVGRPDQSVIEVRSAQLWCPLPSGTVQLLLVAGGRAREGLAGLATLAASWRWLPTTYGHDDK